MSTDVHVGTHDRGELLHFLTQPTRFAIIANILQHPDQLPSLYELEQCNPDVSKATVYKHVQKLNDVGVLEAVTLPDEERQQGLPGRFTPSRRMAGTFSSSTACSRLKAPSRRSTRRSRTNPRRWFGTRTHHGPETARVQYRGPVRWYSR